VRLISVIHEAGGISFIKTSTGFGSSGANLHDVELFRDTLQKLGSNIKIKAAGGIRTKADCEKYLSAGASRIGASNIRELI